MVSTQPGSGPLHLSAPQRPLLRSPRGLSGRATSGGPCCPLPRPALAAASQAVPTWEELLGQR